jgi:predicted lipid-binding transport protein (Tim44 family)
VSQQNVEVQRSIIVAFNAGDMEAVREMLDPDVAIGRELEGGQRGSPGPAVTSTA